MRSFKTIKLFSFFISDQLKTADNAMEIQNEEHGTTRSPVITSKCVFNIELILWSENNKEIL